MRIISEEASTGIDGKFKWYALKVSFTVLGFISCSTVGAPRVLVPSASTRGPLPMFAKLPLPLKDVKSPALVAFAMFVFCVVLAFRKTRKYLPPSHFTRVPPGKNLPIVGCLLAIDEAWLVLPDWVLSMNKFFGGKT